MSLCWEYICKRCGKTFDTSHPDPTGVCWGCWTAADELKWNGKTERYNKLRKRNVCACGKEIDAARLSLDLDTCFECAKQIPGNILRTMDPSVVVSDAVIEAHAKEYHRQELFNALDKGNALVPSTPPDNRLVSCLKCNQIFNLSQNHICPTTL